MSTGDPMSTDDPALSDANVFGLLHEQDREEQVR